MKTPLSRFKLSLILTVAVYLPSLWVLALSSGPLVSAMGIPKLLLWGLLMSFGAAYAIMLFISALRKSE